MDSICPMGHNAKSTTSKRRKERRLGACCGLLYRWYFLRNIMMFQFTDVQKQHPEARFICHMEFTAQPILYREKSKSFQCLHCSVWQFDFAALILGQINLRYKKRKEKKRKIKSVMLSYDGTKISISPALRVWLWKKRRMSSQSFLWKQSGFRGFKTAVRTASS